MFQQKVYTPKTSFSQIPSVQQIVSYLLFLMQILIFYIIIQKRITNSTARIGMIIAYSISTIIHIISTLLVSLSDPSDELMIKYRNDKQNLKSKDIGNSLYCQYCCSYVKRTSRHCKICERCVQYFDHHCIWINNCIGGKNYRIFSLMLAFTFITLVIYMVSVCILWSQHEYDSYMKQMGLVWASGGLVIVLILLIMNLGILHIYLFKIGMTTYEYIMLDKPTTAVNSYPVINSQEMTQQNLQYNLNNTNININNKDKNENVEMKTGLNDNVMNDNIKQEVVMELKSTGIPLTPVYKIIQVKQKKQQKSQTLSQISQNSFSQKSIKPKRNQITPIIIQQKRSNIFQQDKQSKVSQMSGRSKVSHFFANNRSLKMLIHSQADMPYQEDCLMGELKQEKRKESEK